MKSLDVPFARHKTALALFIGSAVALTPVGSHAEAPAAKGNESACLQAISKATDSDLNLSKILDSDASSSASALLMSSTRTLWLVALNVCEAPYKKIAQGHLDTLSALAGQPEPRADTRTEPRAEPPAAQMAEKPPATGALADDAMQKKHCAALTDKAQDLTQKLAQDIRMISMEQRMLRRDQIETLWRDATRQCKGVPADKAREQAEKMAASRGSRPLTALPVDGMSDQQAQSMQDAPTRQKVDGVTYIGQFRPDGTGHLGGDGVVEWDTGERFEGRFTGGKAQGKGVFTWANGQKYEGAFQDGLPSGVGKLTYAGTQDVYEGEFQAGQPHGMGTYQYKNGEKFIGEWKQGRRMRQATLSGQMSTQP